MQQLLKQDIQKGIYIGVILLTTFFIGVVMTMSI